MSSGWLSTRAAAYWLIALVIFPFSAPLSVCDLSDLVPGTTDSITAPLSNTPVRVSVVKDALSQPFPIRVGSTRTRRAAPLQRGPALVVIAAKSKCSDLCTSTETSSLARPITKTILRI
jgi:hypothetical protein